MGSRKVFTEYLNHGQLIALVLIICSARAFAVDYVTEKPDYVQTCKIYEPGFTKCSTSSIQKVMSAVFAGIPALSDKLGQLNPLKLDTVLFKSDGNEAATLQANLTDMLVTGISDLRIDESKVSKKDFSWETKIFIPKLSIAGIYNMEGRVLLLPLSGNGKFSIDIDNLDVLMHTKTRLIEKGPYTFYNVTKIRVDLEMKGLKTHFGNLFNGRSKEVERSTNEFFNSNWRDFLEALRPLINETVERILHRILREVFLYIPANFLVEDIPTPEKLYGPKGSSSSAS